MGEQTWLEDHLLYGYRRDSQGIEESFRKQGGCHVDGSFAAKAGLGLEDMWLAARERS